MDDVDVYLTMLFELFCRRLVEISLMMADVYHTVHLLSHTVHKLTDGNPTQMSSMHMALRVFLPAQVSEYNG